MAKKQYPEVTKYMVSPKGIASYPYVTKPDTKFDPDGVFKADLIVSEEDSKSLREALEKQVEDFKADLIEKAKTPKQKKAYESAGLHLPFEEQEDDEGNLTGDYVIRFKQKAKINDKPVKIRLFDAKGKPIKGDVKLGGGSVIRIEYQAACYFNQTNKSIGVTLRFLSVQVIELKEWGSGGDSPFGAEEGAMSMRETMRGPLVTLTPMMIRLLLMTVVIIKPNDAS